MATPVTVDLGFRIVNAERDIQNALRRINPVIRTSLDARSIRAFQEPLGQISKKTSEFEKSLAAANARVIAFGASVGVLTAAYRGFTQLLKVTIDVEKSLADINVVLNTNREGLRKFSNELFSIAKNTGQTFKVAADAATELARQGLSAEETLKRVNNALILTRLSGLDAVSSVEALTATVNGFARTGLQTTEIINKLANVDAAFAVSSRDLAQALSRVGSTAQDANVSFDELLAIITSVQQTTARGGAVIGNSLKTIFTRLGRSSTITELENLGVTVRDVSGATLPAIKILEELAKTFDTVGTAQKNAIAEQVGGVFQINILRSALRDLSKEHSIYSNALSTSLSSTDQAFRRNIELNKTLASIINATTQEIVKFANQIGEIAVAPALRDIIGEFNDFLSIFTENGKFGGALNSLLVNLAKGVANIFTGPGLIVSIFAFAKLAGRALNFVRESSAVFLQGSTRLDNQKRIQTEINAILRANNGEYARELNKITQIADKEAYILKLIRARSQARASADYEGIALARALNRKININPDTLAVTNRIPRFGASTINGKYGSANRLPSYSIPNFANYSKSVRTEKFPETTIKNVSLRNSDTGSFLRYARDKVYDPKSINIDFIKSNKKGDAFALFNELIRRTGSKNPSIYSSGLVPQTGGGLPISSSFDQFLKFYPQIKYRMQPGLSTRGTISHTSPDDVYYDNIKFTKFKSLAQLEKIVNGLVKRRGPRIFDVHALETKLGTPNFAVPNFLPTNLLRPFRSTLRGINSGKIYVDPNINQKYKNSTGLKGVYGEYNPYSDNITLSPSGATRSQTLAHESVHRFVNRTGKGDFLAEAGFTAMENNPLFNALAGGYRKNGYQNNIIAEEMLANFNRIPPTIQDLIAKELGFKNSSIISRLYDRLQRASHRRIMRGDFVEGAAPNFAHNYGIPLSREQLIAERLERSPLAKMALKSGKANKEFFKRLITDPYLKPEDALSIFSENPLYRNNYESTDRGPYGSFIRPSPFGFRGASSFEINKLLAGEKITSYGGRSYDSINGPLTRLHYGSNIKTALRYNDEGYIISIIDALKRGGQAYAADTNTAYNFSFGDATIKEVLGTFKKTKNGLKIIPRFADPIQSAISREIIQGGISPSQVRIEQSPKLIAPHNPLGFAITNTRDEPGGLDQGINRAIREGQNPKTYNIPGFADRPAKLSQRELQQIIDLVRGGNIKGALKQTQTVLQLKQEDKIKFENAIRNKQLQEQAEYEAFFDSISFGGKIGTPKNYRTGRFISGGYKPPSVPPVAIAGGFSPIGPRLPSGTFQSKYLPKPNRLLQLGLTQAESAAGINLENNINSIFGGQRFSSIRGIREILNKGSIGGTKYFSTLQKLTNPANQTTFEDIFRQTGFGVVGRHGERFGGAAITKALQDAAAKIRSMGATTEQINELSQKLAPELQKYRVGLQQNNTLVSERLKQFKEASKLNRIESSIAAGQQITAQEAGHLIRVQKGQFLKSRAQELFGPEFANLTTRQKSAVYKGILGNEDIKGAFMQIENSARSLQKLPLTFEQFLKKQGPGRFFRSGRSLEEGYINQLLKTNPNANVESVRDSFQQRRIEASAKNFNRLFAASFIASGISGVLPQNTRGGRLTSETIGGAATGASFGLFSNSLKIGVIGAVIGGLTSLYQALNDTSMQIEGINKSIEDTIDKNTKLVNSTQSYVQLRQQIEESIRAGASELEIKNFVNQSNEALKAINDPKIRADLLKAGRDQKAIDKVIADISLKTQRESLRNDIRQSNAGIISQNKPFTDSLLRFLGNNRDRIFEQGSLQNLGQLIGRFSNFNSVEEVDKFIQNAYEKPAEALNTFSDKLNITNTEVEEILGAFENNASGFRTVLFEIGDAVKESLNIRQTSNIRENILKFEKQLDQVLTDINRQIGVENKTREFETQFQNRLRESFTTARNNIGNRDAYTQIAEQLRSQLQSSALSARTSRTEIISSGLGGLFKELQQNNETSTKLQAIQDVLSGKTPFNLNNLLDVFKGSGKDQIKILKDIGADLIILNEQTRRSNQELKIIADLNKIQVTAEQKNKILENGAFDINRGRDFERNFLGASRRFNFRNNQIAALEKTLSSLDAYGLPQSEAVKNERLAIRRESTFISFADALSRITGRKVGANQADIERAASGLAAVKGGDVSSTLQRIIGKEFLLGIRTLNINPEEQLKKLQESINKGDISALNDLSLDTKGVISATNRVKESIDTNVATTNERLGALLSEYRSNKEAIDAQNKILDERLKKFEENVAERNKERIDQNALFGIDPNKISNFFKLVSIATDQPRILNSESGKDLITRQSKELLDTGLIKEIDDKSVKFLRDMLTFFDKNSQTLVSNPEAFKGKFIETFTQQIIDLADLPIGADGKKILDERVTEFIKVMIGRIIEQSKKTELTPIKNQLEAERAKLTPEARRELNRSYTIPEQNKLIQETQLKITELERRQKEIEDKYSNIGKAPEETVATKTKNAVSIKDILSKSGSLGTGLLNGLSNALFGVSSKTIESGINKIPSIISTISDKPNSYSPETPTDVTSEASTSSVKKSSTKLFLEGLIEELKATEAEFQSLKDIGVDTAKSIQSSFGNAFADFATGAKSGSEAFRSFITSILNDAARAYAQKGVNELFSAIGSSASKYFNKSANGGKVFASGGKVPSLVMGGEYIINKNTASNVGYNKLFDLNNKKYANGGYVNTGSGIRDDVPMILNSGDFVMKRSAVQKYGKGFFDGMVSRYANGGIAHENLHLGSSTSIGSSTSTGSSSTTASIGSSIKGSLYSLAISLALSYISKLFEEKPKGPYYNYIERQKQLEEEKRKYGSDAQLFRGPDGQIIGYGKIAMPKEYSGGGRVSNGEYIVPNYAASKIGYSNLRRYNEGGANGTINANTSQNQPININISNNFNATTSNGAISNDKDQQSENKTNTELATKLNERIKNVVRETLIQEQRNGGLLKR